MYLEPRLAESATLLMQDGNNSNQILISNKVHGVRESAHQYATRIFEDAGICERINARTRDSDIQIKQKLNAET